VPQDLAGFDRALGHPLELVTESNPVAPLGPGQRSPTLVGMERADVAPIRTLDVRLVALLPAATAEKRARLPQVSDVE